MQEIGSFAAGHRSTSRLVVDADEVRRVVPRGEPQPAAVPLQPGVGGAVGQPDRGGVRRPQHLAEHVVHVADVLVPVTLRPEGHEGDVLPVTVLGALERPDLGGRHPGPGPIGPHPDVQRVAHLARELGRVALRPRLDPPADVVVEVTDAVRGHEGDLGPAVDVVGQQRPVAFLALHPVALPGQPAQPPLLGEVVLERLGRSALHRLEPAVHVVTGAVAGRLEVALERLRGRHRHRPVVRRRDRGLGRQHLRRPAPRHHQQDKAGPGRAPPAG